MTHDYLISLIRPAVPAAVDALLVPSTVHMRRVPALCRGYGKARGPGEGLAPGPRPRTSALGDSNLERLPREDLLSASGAGRAVTIGIRAPSVVGLRDCVASYA